MVTIYDASGLMPLQLELAERYVLVNVSFNLYFESSFHLSLVLTGHMNRKLIVIKSYRELSKVILIRSMTSIRG